MGFLTNCLIAVGLAAAAAATNMEDPSELDRAIQATITKYPGQHESIWSTVSNALSAMDFVRAPVFRHPTRTYNFLRNSNFEALVGSFVGQVTTNKCRHCVRGFGPWEECIAVQGYFGGACTNCHMNNTSNRCSLSKFTAQNYTYNNHN